MYVGGTPTFRSEHRVKRTEVKNSLMFKWNGKVRVRGKVLGTRLERQAEWIK